MNRQLPFKLSFILVIILCWVDYQYFTEGFAQRFSPMARQAGHFIILTCIMLSGYAGWRTQEERWMKKIWLTAYATGIFMIGAAGILQYIFQLFPIAVLDKISAVRIFLGSPVPYFILYLISRLNHEAALEKY